MIVKSTLRKLVRICLIQKRRIINTVGSGFIGTNSVRQFIDKGSELLNLDLAPLKKDHLECSKEINALDCRRFISEIISCDPRIFLHIAVFGEPSLDYSIDSVRLQPKRHNVRIFQ
jgi:hypothetical protein